MPSAVGPRPLRKASTISAAGRSCGRSEWHRSSGFLPGWVRLWDLGYLGHVRWGPRAQGLRRSPAEQSWRHSVTRRFQDDVCIGLPGRTSAARHSWLIGPSIDIHVRDESIRRAVPDTTCHAIGGNGFSLYSTKYRNCRTLRKLRQHRRT